MTGRSSFPYSRTQSVPPGTELSNMFVIEQLLSAGGMGEVYKGRNIQTDDPVAIKIVLPEFAQDSMILDLFRKEARILNHLNDEAIVRYYVFSIDAALGCPFLAMEFVDGEALSDRIKAGPLAIASVVTLQRRLADGLQKAHNAGVIHRDIAPDNIILPEGRAERAKIIDFGIARSAVVEGGTLLGSSFAGKYNFVSPEQLGLFGAEVTNRTDIYSLGLVLAACLRGAPLDMSGTQVEIIDKRRSVPDLSDIDPRMRGLIAAMLQPDPNDRPQSMAEVAGWQMEETETEPERTKIATRHPATGHPAESPANVAIPPSVQAPMEHSPRRSPAELSPHPVPLREPPARSPRGRRPARPRLGLYLATCFLVAVLLIGGGGWYYVENWSRDWREARPLPVADADATPPVSDPEPSPSRAAEMVEFVRSYEGGDCLSAVPRELGADQVAIDGLGRQEPIEKLLFDFKDRFGVEPTMQVQPVTEAQCIVVGVLHRLIRDGTGRLALELNRHVVQSGQVLSGTVSGLGSLHIEILLVDHEGLVFNLSRLPGDLTERQGDDVRFAVTLEGEPTRPAPQLIVPLASDAPLRSLAEPWQGGFISAGELIPSLLDEVASRPDGVAATAGYFTFSR